MQVLKVFQSSIFYIAEAEERAGVKTGRTPKISAFARGRNDRPPLVVATTMFRGAIECDVPINGTIELGITQEKLAELVRSAQVNGNCATVEGEFVVNHKPASGKLMVNFTSHDGELEYVQVVQQTAAA